MRQHPTLKEVEAKYREIKQALQKRPGPKLPSLRHTRGAVKKFTVQGLSLTFFALHMGKVVEKVELLRFLRRMRVVTTDPQPRHLGMQNGFNFLVAGCQHPRLGTLKRGQYCLLSLSASKRSSFTQRHRIVKVNALQFSRLKKRFGNKCASCGSLEGAPHLKNKLLETTLQKGHMDPRRELVLSNCIPMCSMCNSVYKDKAVFNRNGFVKTWLVGRRASTY